MPGLERSQGWGLERGAWKLTELVCLRHEVPQVAGGVLITTTVKLQTDPLLIFTR